MIFIPVSLCGLTKFVVTIAQKEKEMNIIFIDKI